MKPYAVPLAGLVLAGGLDLVVPTVSTGGGALARVCRVCDLQAGLADNPQAGLGHTVLVLVVALGRACPSNSACVFAWPAHLAGPGVDALAARTPQHTASGKAPACSGISA